VNVAGGGERSKVFFSASYLDEEGYVINTDFNRLTTRLNGEFNVTDRLTIGGSANISIAESNSPGSTGGSIANPFGFAKNIGSIYPVYVNDRNGDLVRDAGGNPIFDNGEGYPDFGIGTRPISQGRHALQELILNDNQDLDNTIGFRYNIDYEIIDGLSVSLNYGRDINELFNKRYENNIIGDAQPTGRYRELKSRRSIENFNQLINFSRTFDGVHNLDVTLGHESFDRSFNTSQSLVIEQTAEGIFEFDNFASPVSVSGSSTQKNVESYFSRLNYNFDNKYYISASARRDGSSVFGRNTRWGNFYSVGASWRMDREEFIQDLGFVDQLKLRASFGQVGSDNLGDFFISQPRYNLTSNAGAPAIVWSDIGNANLQWETVDSYDVALEFGLFNNLSGSIEYFRRNSTELLYDLPIAPSNGLNSFPANVADMYNSGWEFSLSSSLVDRSDFKWDLTLIGTTYKNRIVNIPDPFIDGTKRWENGRSRFEFFSLHTAGVDPATGDQLFLMFEFDDDGNSVPVLDANGVQEVTNDWQETERAYTGKDALPDFTGSVNNTFTYKGFNLNVLVTYGIGGYILDGGYSAMMHSGNFGSSLHPDILNAWSQPGDITDVPRMENGNPNLVRGNSTRFLTDASYWALRNINLGYRFDNTLTESLGVDSLTLSLTGENLYVSSARDGMNPQFNVSGTPAGNTYNPSRIFSLGLNVSF
jgi:TonB-linked SusC/RagA family outer membrane protein